ncbi:MAG: NAD(P)H-dependent oxidoreductase [Bacteroidota bacterium]
MILFFHPLLHKSRVNKELLRAVEDLDEVTVRIMYDLYPDFHINVSVEQELLLKHDVIVWQHPFYWYSAPSLLKEWIDLVFEHGFAYGKEGRALEGKKLISAITTGGRKEAYMATGPNRYSMRELLSPFEQTGALCRMNYLPPFVVHGTHLLNDDGIMLAGEKYRKVIQNLREDRFTPEEFLKHDYFNDIIA